MPKKLYLLILKSFIGPLILTFFISIFVLLMQFLWKYVDDLVGKGLEISILAQLMFYASTTFVPMALPLAILLSSLMVYGNLGEHYELAAAKSVGISLKKMMLPLFIVCALLAVIAFFFSNNMLPYTNLKMRTLLYDITNAKPALNIKEGIFYRDIDNFVIKVGKKEKDNKTIHNVIIYDHTNFAGNSTVTFASKGYMETTPDKKFLILTLFDGFSYNEQLEKREHYFTRPFEKIRFAEQTIRLDLSSFALQRTNEDFFKDHYQMMNLKQLRYTLDSIKKYVETRQNAYAEQTTIFWNYYSRIKKDQLDTIKTNNSFSIDSLLKSYTYPEKINIINTANRLSKNLKEITGYHYTELEDIRKYSIRYRIEGHRKFTLSIACILLFFIGAPLGAIVRKGGLGMPLVLATLIFVLYYIISVTGEKFAREGLWLPGWGMWFSSIFMFPFSIWLTYAASNDNKLLNLDWYSTKIQKLVSLFSKKQL